jgi:rubrerythrin
MAQQQTIGQIIRLAIQREQNAYSFLMAMSECVKSPEIKYMFADLAKEELGHKDKLELELMKIGEVVRPGDSQIETENIFSIEADECRTMDYADLLRLCIEKEDISFRFYIDLATQMTQDESRDAILALAEEELRHKLRFETEFDKLPRSK